MGASNSVATQAPPPQLSIATQSNSQLPFVNEDGHFESGEVQQLAPTPIDIQAKFWTSPEPQQPPLPPPSYFGVIMAAILIILIVASIQNIQMSVFKCQMSCSEC